MQGGLSHARNVCPSVRPSIRLSNAWKHMPNFLYPITDIPSSLADGSGPFYLKFWELTPLERKRGFSIDIRSQHLSLAKKRSFNTNRKSTMRFPMTLSHQRGSKKQNGCFPSKIALCLKKVCYKLPSCENRQRQSCKAFTSLSIRAKMVHGGRKKFAETDQPPSQSPISNQYSLVAPQP